jgi:8-amino-7-oxononanoate synthase
MPFDFIATNLAQRAQQNMLRQRRCFQSKQGALAKIDGRYVLNFCSNDYLGLGQSSAVMQAWLDGICLYGAGSGASPLVSGYQQIHADLESYLASALKRDKVLLFSSGFAANQAICQALFAANMNRAKSPTGLILADKLMHASFIDGALASDASLKRFTHNNMQALQAQLQVNQGGNPSRDVLIASESIFSMDGDQCPVEDLVGIAKASNSWLMIDDAHGFGVLGQQGFGVVEAHQLSQQALPVVMGTFGKAIGTAGAFVAGSSELIDYLINFARHYIYSTAMPAAQAHATLCSLKENVDPSRRNILTQRIAQFKALALSAKLPIRASDTAIQPLLIGDAGQALVMSKKLQDLGIWVSAIRSPTVPVGSDRLRITLSALHKEGDIEALVQALSLCMPAQAPTGLADA